MPGVDMVVNPDTDVEDMTEYSESGVEDMASVRTIMKQGEQIPVPASV